MSYQDGLVSPTGPTSQSEEALVAERKRDIVVLIMRFLYDYGFVSSYQALCTEVNFSLNQIDAADNVDLWGIIQEYVDFQHIRFARYPRLVRHPYADYAQGPAAGGSGSMVPTSLNQPSSVMQQPSNSTAVLMPSLLAASQGQQQPFTVQQQQQQRQQQGGISSGLHNLKTEPVPGTAANAGRYDYSPMSQHLGRSETSGMQHLEKYSGHYGGSTPGARANNGGEVSHPGSQRTSTGGGISGGGIVSPTAYPFGGSAGGLGSGQHTGRGSQQQQSSSSMAHDDSDGGNVFVAFTTRIGSGERITQEDFCDTLMHAPMASPSQLLSFTRPKRTHTKRRSSQLALSDLQEEALYALVGCAGVGWLIKNITKATKEFLQRRFSIDKDLLQLFFKNRAQKSKRRRTPACGRAGRGDGGGGGVHSAMRGSISGDDDEAHDATACIRLGRSRGSSYSRRAVDDDDDDDFE